jgi:hypothetical protein
LLGTFVRNNVQKFFACRPWNYYFHERNFKCLSLS